MKQVVRRIVVLFMILLMLSIPVESVLYYPSEPISNPFEEASKIYSVGETQKMDVLQVTEFPDFFSTPIQISFIQPEFTLGNLNIKTHISNINISLSVNQNVDINSRETVDELPYSAPVDIFDTENIFSDKEPDCKISSPKSNSIPAESISQGPDYIEKNPELLQQVGNLFLGIYGDTSSPLSCTDNGGWCPCYYGCSIADCCSTTCEENTCLDYGCYPDYPNECDDSCWTTCSSGNNFICDSNDGAVCCPDDYPYYCYKDNSCWDGLNLPNPCGSGCPSGTTECNGDCYTCDDSSRDLCCPSSGDPNYCCTDAETCESDGSCSSPECYVDSDCSPDTYYCSGDLRKFKNYFCDNNDCDYTTSTYDDCSNLNQWVCLDATSRAYLDYTCAIESNLVKCVYTETGQQSCAWGCSGGSCVSTTKVHGYMKKSNGNGISNVKFILEDCSSGAVIASDNTDSNGYYEINANAGSYKLSVDYLGYNLDLTSCQSFGGDLSVTDVVLAASLEGNIKYSNGNGRSGVVVKLKDCSNNVISTDTTDSNGYYYVNAADAGNYKLTMAIYGSEAQVIDCSGVLPGMSVTDITIPAGLSGYIQDTSGNGISGITARLTDCSGNSRDSDITDSNGYFDVEYADAGYFDFEFDYKGYTFSVFDCEAIAWYGQFTNPIEMWMELHGYLKDLNDNPLVNYNIELYDCSDNFVASSSTSATGHFSVYDDSDNYKILINMGGGWKIKLVDQNDNDCFFLYGDIDVGTLNINPSPDCSVFDYQCYQDDIKLFGCFWDDIEKFCKCYGTQCIYGCTDGVQECDYGEYGKIFVDVDDFSGTSMPGAHVFMDGYYQGATDSTGKINFQAPYGYRNIDVQCSDSTACDSTSIYVNGDEYYYVDCNCGGAQKGDLLIDLSVVSDDYYNGNPDYYRTNTRPISFVYVEVDGQPTGKYTDLSGQAVIRDLDYGDHQIKLNFCFKDDTEQKGCSSAKYGIFNAHIDSSQEIRRFGVEESDLYAGTSAVPMISTGNKLLLNSYEPGEFDEQFICAGLCIAAVVIVTVAIIAWDAKNVYDCNERDNFDIDEWSKWDCWDEVGWLVLNFVPLGYIAGKVAKGGVIVGRGIKYIPLIGDGVEVILKYGDDAFKVISKVSSRYTDEILEYVFKYADDGTKTLKVLRNAVGWLYGHFDEAAKTYRLTVDNSGKLVRMADKVFVQGDFLNMNSGQIQGELAERNVDLILAKVNSNYKKVDNAIDIIVWQDTPGRIFTKGNYKFKVRPNGKSVEFFDKSTGKLLGEIDRVVVIGDKPIMVEVKSGKLSNFKSDIAPAKINQKLDAVKDLYGAEPDNLLIVASDVFDKQTIPGSSLYNYVHQTDGKVLSLYDSSYTYESAGRLLDSR